jgi:hypothetical protein
VGFSTTTNYEAALQRWRCSCVNVKLLTFDNAIRVLQKCCVTVVSVVAVGMAQRCHDITAMHAHCILIFMQRSLVSTGVRNLTEKYAETIVQYGFYGDLKGYLDGMFAFANELRHVRVSVNLHSVRTVRRAATAIRVTNIDIVFQ